MERKYLNEEQNLTTEGKIIGFEKYQAQLDALITTVVFLEDMLSKKVDKDQVINQINLSEEGIRIEADKILINGKTMIEEGAIHSAHILSVDASKIKAESLSAISTKLGNVELTPQANDGEERSDLGTKINSDIVVKKSIELSRIVDL